MTKKKKKRNHVFVWLSFPDNTRLARDFNCSDWRLCMKEPLTVFFLTADILMSAAQR